MKRRIISLMIAVFLILGMPMQALAKTHEVENFDDVYNAFENDKDPEVTINLTNSIEWGGPLTTTENQTYTVNGNGNTISGTVGADGGGTMNVNADISGSVHAYGGSDVNVTGSITSTTTSDGYTNGSIYATGEGSSISVSGNADIVYVEANGGADVTIAGTVVANNIHASSEGSSITVNDDVTVNYVDASNGADVTISGTVTGSGEDSAIFASGDGSNVCVSDGIDVHSVGVSHNGILNVTGDVKADSISASSYDENDNITRGTVNIEGNVDVAYGVNVGAGAVAVDGSFTGQYIVVNGGDAAVSGDVTITGSEAGYGYVDVDDGGMLTVEGNVDTVDLWVNNSSELTVGSIDADYISVSGNSELTVGSIDADYISVSGNSELTAEGNVSAVNGTTINENSTATIGGNITSENSNALQAIAGSTVTIGGDAIGGSDVFTREDGVVIANGGVGVVADDSNVTVKGDVVGGSVIAPADADRNQGGIGVAAMGSAVVSIEGNVTGGNATTGSGVGGFGVFYEDFEKPFTGSVTVGGTVTGGKGGPNGMDGPAYVSSSTGIIVPPAEAVPDAAPKATPVEEPEVKISIATDSEMAELTVTVSANKEEVVIEELKAEELDALLDALKESTKEEAPDTVTIDVSAFEDVSTVRIPAEVLKALIETFGKLEIIFDGGVLLIDAAEFEKLVVEFGFVTIKLK